MSDPYNDPTSVLNIGADYRARNQQIAQNLVWALANSRQFHAINPHP